MTYCRNPACQKSLDPERVARHKATTCDAKCRAAAWKAEKRYGRGQAPAPPRANAGTRRRQPRAGVTVYFPTVEDAEVAMWIIRSFPNDDLAGMVQRALARKAGVR